MMRNAAMIAVLAVGLGACGSSGTAEPPGSGGVAGTGGAVSSGSGSRSARVGSAAPLS